jgi:anti-sigma B factor antagonist
MEFQQLSQGAVTVLKPAGPLVVAEVEPLRAAALELAVKNMGRLVLDASAVPFLDSRGIEVLVELTEQLADSGRALKLSGANSTVRQSLELVGWGDAFEYFDDVNAATRSFL